jgi:hypothetical protein
MLNVWVIFGVLKSAVHASHEGEALSIIGIGISADSVGVFESLVGSVSGVNAGSRVSWAFDAFASKENSRGNWSDSGDGVVESILVYPASRPIVGDD